MRLFSATLALTLAVGTLSQGFAADPRVIQKRVDALLGKMTLQEKIGQLNQYSSTFDITGPAPTLGANQIRFQRIRDGLVGSMLNVTGVAATRRAQELAVENSRLGIPMIFAFDVIHGYQTMFPIPLAEAASWDLEAIELSSRIAATEAAAAGLHWTFAPMVDISRDARWGRVMEGAGEDPVLGAHVAVARIRGFQGENLRDLDTLAACAKHFAAYGFAEGGRDYNTVDISEQTLRNVVLPPFKAAVEAGVATFMNGFNEIGGEPVTASVHLQREILKEEWGFAGFVVSDWNSIGELVPHGVAHDLREAAQLAIVAGSDMDMEADAYIGHLADLVENNAIDVSLIDDAVRRVLTLKFQLGLFDDPYRYSDAEREQELIYSRKHRDAARDVARKSIVLLENKDQRLPLEKKGVIAVIGPLADDKDTPLGSWRGKAVTNSAVSLLEGMRTAIGNDAEIRHAAGAPLAVGPRTFINELTLNRDDRSGFPAAIAAARGADVVVMALGEEAFQSGEGRSQVAIGLAGVQMDLLKAVHAVNPNIVLVLMNGRPLVLDWISENVPAIVVAWHLGSEAGHAIADVLFGAHNPSGKLPMSFPRHVGQMPLYYNQKNTGRPGPRDDGLVFWSHYTDEKNDALYPFGYGLSYTGFAYGDLSLSATEIGFDDTLTVSVTVTNTGQRTGSEVVQLYVRDRVGSVTRPLKELKGFEKITLEPGTSQKVSFTLNTETLAFFTRAGTWQAEAGAFDVFVGTNSRDVQQARFELKD